MKEQHYIPVQALLPEIKATPFFGKRTRFSFAAFRLKRTPYFLCRKISPSRRVPESERAQEEENAFPQGQVTNG